MEFWANFSVVCWVVSLSAFLPTEAQKHAFQKVYGSSAGYSSYPSASGDLPSIFPAKIQPADYGLVSLPYAYATRAPFNAAATEWPYAGGVNSQTNTTVSPRACKSTTFRTNLNCPCKLIGQRCFPPNSKCVAAAPGDGLCVCASGYVAFNFSCVLTDSSAQNFTLLSPLITASCFLPLNAPIGNIPQVGANGSVVYTLQLVSTLPVTTVSTSFISIESSTGNLLFVSAPPVTSVTNQTYSVYGTDSTGVTSNILKFTVLYNCKAPTVSFDLGNNFIVDCGEVNVGDIIVTALAAGSVAPSTFAMTLVSSTSTLLNTYYAIDPTNGQIFLQNEPHGGIFIEVYSVTTTNAVGQTSVPQVLTLTTTATCT